MKMRGFISALLLIISGYAELMASHIAGAEISYRHLYAGTYSFQLKVYRDCNECKFNNIGGGENNSNCNDVPSLTIKGALGTAYSSSVLGTVETIRKSITDLTPACFGSVSKCRTGSNLPYGYEEHVFEGVYDFAGLLGNGYCKFDVSISMSSRNININTQNSEQTFFNFAMLNLCEGLSNQSTQFLSAPGFFYMQNRSNFISAGVKNADSDSLAFHLRPALVNRNQGIAYASGRNQDAPYTYFCSSGAPSCAPNPLAPIAEGFYCSGSNGDIVFTPIQANQGGVLVLECEEWKKNASGIYFLAGVTRRDVYGDVVAQINNTPLIKDLITRIDVCENESFTKELNVEDQAVPGLPADTVHAKILTDMNGVTLEKIPVMAAPYFRYVLRAESGMNPPGLYFITVQLRDNHCPINAVSSRTIAVRVNKSRVLNTIISAENCGMLEAGLLNFANRTVFWNLKNSDGLSLADANAKKFKYQLPGGGKYYVELYYPSEPGFCEIRQKDSIAVQPFRIPELLMPADFKVCNGSTVVVQPLKFDSWAGQTLSVNGQQITGFPYTYTADQNKSLNFQVNQDDGCKASATLNVTLHPKLIYTKRSDSACVNGVFPMPVRNIGFDPAKVNSIQYTYSSTGSVLQMVDRHKWNLRLNNASAHVMTLYSTVLDNNLCTYRDTSTIHLLAPDPVTVTCPDKLCINAAPYKLQTMQGGSWECVNYPALLKNNELVPNAKTFSTLILKYTQIRRCSNSETFYIQPLDTTPITFAHPSDIKLCENAGLFQLAANPAGGLWTGDHVQGNMYNPLPAAGKSGTLIYTYTNANACRSQSGIRMTVEKLPALKVLASAPRICVGDVLQLQALSSLQSPGYWYTDGDGSFERPASTVTAYRPSSSDVLKGRIRFTYTLQTGGICGNISHSAETEVRKGPQGDITDNYPSGICEPASLVFSTNFKSLEKQYWFLNDSLVEDFDYGFDYKTVLPAGEYVVKTRVKDSACEAMAISRNITVYPKPVPVLSSNPVQKVSKEYPRLFLRDKTSSPNGHSSNWYFNQQWIGSEKEFFYRVDDSKDSFYIKLLVKNNLGGCTDSAVHLFVFMPILQLYIPDAFSPDTKGPQENNHFRVYGPDMRYFHIEVFNKYGEKVYVSDNMNESWDGRYMNTDCMQGVYFYKASSTDHDGISRDYSGTVTLIR